MKIYNSLKFCLWFIYYYRIKCVRNYSLDEITRPNDFYQITSFTSNDLIDSKTLTFSKHPGVRYLIGKNHKSIHKIPYSLKKSLITFHTSNLSEVQSFIDFLEPQLTIRKRPKCLIISDDSGDEIPTDEALKYAWKNKFLDFTIMIDA